MSINTMGNLRNRSFVLAGLCLLTVSLCPIELNAQAASPGSAAEQQVVPPEYSAELILLLFPYSRI